MANVYDLESRLKRKADKADNIVLPLDGDGTPPHHLDMSLGERIARLEGAMEGVRHSQNMTLVALGIVGAVLATISIYTLQRVDQIDGRMADLERTVAALPGQISAELRDISKTLAENITAARQPQPPVIIQVPAPAAPPPQQ